jgi:Uma2 family endonuclease
MLRNFTLEEYFDFNAQSPFKNEYFQGEILAMPGATDNHNVITTRIASALDQCIEEKDRDCYVYTHDMQLHIPVCRLTVYPDLMVRCGQAEYLEGKENLILLNPVIIGEVLSSSTEKYDREHKLPCYMTIPSVEIVFLASQKEKKIEVFRKVNKWDREVYEADNTLIINECMLDLQRIYKRLKLEHED